MAIKARAKAGKLLGALGAERGLLLKLRPHRHVEFMPPLPCHSEPTHAPQIRRRPSRRHVELARPLRGLKARERGVESQEASRTQADEEVAHAHQAGKVVLGL